MSPASAALHGARVIRLEDRAPVWVFDAAHPPCLSIWPPQRASVELTGCASPMTGRWRATAHAQHFVAEIWPTEGRGTLHLAGRASAWAVAFEPPPDDPALRSARERRRAGAFREALGLLDAVDWTSPAQQLAALELRARLYRDLGALTEAAAAWVAGAELASTCALPIEAARRWRAAAFIDLTRRRFVAAERSAAQARAAASAVHDPPDALRALYLDGLLAEARADLLGSAACLERAHAIARRLDAPEQGAIRAQRGMLELRLGRPPAARRLLVDAAPRPAGLHEEVNHALQRAWFAAHEQLTGEADDGFRRARRAIEDARRALPAEGDVRLWAGCAISAGWVALLDGQVAEARRCHDDAEAVHRRAAGLEPGRDFLAPTRVLLDGRIALAEGRFDRAARVFSALAEAEGRSGLPSPTLWAALHGEGLALRALDRPDDAVAAWTRALRELDRAVIDVGHARAPAFLDAVTLLDVPHRLVDDLVDLLATRQPDAAFAAADAAAARRQRTLSVAGRTARLTPAARTRWSAHLEALADCMQAHAAARADWTLAPPAYDAALARTGRAAEEAFTRAVAALEVGAGADELACTPAALRPALGPDEAVLVCRPRGGRGGEVWWLTVDALERAVTDDATMPWSDDWPRSHLYVVAGGLPAAWRLPERVVDGAPLGAQVRISYLPHARPLLRPRPEARGPVVALVDPEGDLPLARADGRWLAEHHATPTHPIEVVAGDAATPERFLDAMRSAAAVHFGGHGAPEPGQPSQSHLRLALDGAVHAADIVALGRSAARVVLHGCWTGLGFGEGTMSLPTACLMAGAASVLATTEPIDVTRASGFVRRFYRNGGLWSPGEGLRAATAESVAVGEPGWQSWRLLGVG